MNFVTQAQYRSDRRFATANTVMVVGFSLYLGYMIAKRAKETRGSIETMTMAYNRHVHQGNNSTPTPKMQFL